MPRSRGISEIYSSILLIVLALSASLIVSKTIYDISSSAVEDAVDISVSLSTYRVDVGYAYIYLSVYVEGGGEATIRVGNAYIFCDGTVYIYPPDRTIFTVSGSDTLSVLYSYSCVEKPLIVFSVSSEKSLYTFKVK